MPARDRSGHRADILQAQDGTLRRDAAAPADWRFLSGAAPWSLP